MARAHELLQHRGWSKAVRWSRRLERSGKPVFHYLGVMTVCCLWSCVPAISALGVLLPSAIATVGAQDLLIGPNTIADGSFATDVQSRTQVNLWSVIGAPLIISNNLLEASQYNIESYGNEEVIAVNQDPMGVPGYRVVGGDLTYPCSESFPAGALFGVQARACDASDPLQVCSCFLATGFTVVLVVLLLLLFLLWRW